MKDLLVPLLIIFFCFQYAVYKYSEATDELGTKEITILELQAWQDSVTSGVMTLEDIYETKQEGKFINEHNDTLTVKVVGGYVEITK